MSSTLKLWLTPREANTPETSTPKIATNLAVRFMIYSKANSKRFIKEPLHSGSQGLANGGRSEELRSANAFKSDVRINYEEGYEKLP